MSLDLYARETADRIATMPPVKTPEAGAFDGFMRGAGLTTMKNLARTGRSIDMLGAVGPIVTDAITGGTELQDRYFKEHDDVWGSAVDSWTPKPNEVGVAGQITGELLSMLPLVIASPSLAVGSLQLGTAEDLVKKGVDSYKAQAVGAVQAAGLGLGVWMPIIGQNLWQRAVIGGAGFNVAQGVATRGASGLVLDGTPAAEEFKAFDGQALTLDVLLGAAFGGLVHLSPAAREQGPAAWERIQAWAEGLTPTDKAALVTLRLAQHMNVDSTPGRPATPADIQAHVERMRTALEQVERGQPVEVSDLPNPRFEKEPSRVQEMARRADELVKQSERVRKSEDLPPVEETAGAPTEGPAANLGGETEPPPPRGSRRPGEAAGPTAPKPKEGEAPPDPVAVEAQRLVDEQPDRLIRVGSNADGTPIVKTMREYAADAKARVESARNDATLYEVAAACMLGRG